MATAAWLDPLPEADRRGKSRFPLELEVSFCSAGKPPRTEGLGATVNMSSTGLLIRADDHKLFPGECLKVSIEWPWMLDQVTPLRLIAIGSVVRTRPREFALRLKRYQFRTASRKPRAAGA
jgi:hypothetical protein